MQEIMYKKEHYLEQGYKLIGSYPDGNELLARITKINDIPVIQYLYFKDGIALSLTSAYIAVETLDALTNFLKSEEA